MAVFVVDEVGALVLSGLVEKVKHLWKVPRVVQQTKKKNHTQYCKHLCLSLFLCCWYLFYLIHPERNLGQVNVSQKRNN